MHLGRIIVENAEKAIHMLAKLTDATNSKNFTAAPVYFENSSAGTHEWVNRISERASIKAKFDTLFGSASPRDYSDYATLSGTRNLVAS